MPISMDVDMSSVLTASVSSFLTDLDFTVSKDDKRILPPKAKTCVAECIFCVLYCLSSWTLCFKSWSETSMKVVLQILTLNFIMWTLLWNWCMCSEQTHKYHLNSSFGFCYEIEVCALTQTLKFHLNFKFHCSLCLNVFTYLPESQI